MNQREGYRGNTVVHKAGLKIPTWLTVSPVTQSINFYNFFLDDDILLWCLYCKLIHGLCRISIIFFHKNPPPLPPVAMWGGGGLNVLTQEPYKNVPNF